jgi:hypothetical protein
MSIFKIRLLFSSALLAFICGCAGTFQYVPFPDQKVTIADTSKCRIYLYHNTIIGAATASAIVSQNELIGQIGYNSYLCWESPPGNVKIILETFDNDSLVLSTEKLKQYFILQLSPWADNSARSLKVISPDKGRKDISSRKPPNLKIIKIDSTSTRNINEEINSIKKPNWTLIIVGISLTLLGFVLTAISNHLSSN